MTRKSKVSRDQETVIRNFIGSCEFTELKLPKGMMQKLLDMLGYKIAPGGSRVREDIVLSHKCGENVDKVYNDTVYDDWQATTDAEIEADTGARVPPEGD